MTEDTGFFAYQIKSVGGQVRTLADGALQNQTIVTDDETGPVLGDDTLPETIAINGVDYTYLGTANAASGGGFYAQLGRKTFFVSKQDPGAGAPVTLQPDGPGPGGSDFAVCFMPGTRIRTPGGEVPVEALRAGDPVLTASGAVVPVRWLGRQTIVTRFADPMAALPVRVKAGALAAGVPCRDLVLSPGHALLVGGVLVQAGALVNGRSILRERGLPERFTYYHVELPDHALLLAEGTPAESFIDNVSREAFDNWAEHEALPDAAPMAEMALPRAMAWRQLPAAVRRQLEARLAAEPAAA